MDGTALLQIRFDAILLLRDHSYSWKICSFCFWKNITTSASGCTSLDHLLHSRPLESTYKAIIIWLKHMPSHNPNKVRFIFMSILHFYKPRKLNMTLASFFKLSYDTQALSSCSNVALSTKHSLHAIKNMNRVIPCYKLYYLSVRRILISRKANFVKVK